MRRLGIGGLVGLLIVKAMVIQRMEREFEEKYAAGLEHMGEKERGKLQVGIPHVKEKIEAQFMLLTGKDKQKSLVQTYKTEINNQDDTMIQRFMSIGPTNDCERAPFFNFSFDSKKVQKKKASVLRAASLVVQKQNLMSVILL